MVVLVVLGALASCGDDAVDPTTASIGRLTCGGEWNAYSGAGSVVNSDTFEWSEVVITISSIEPRGDDYAFVGDPLEVIEVETLGHGDSVEWLYALPWGYRVEAMTPGGPAECTAFAPGD